VQHAQYPSGVPAPHASFVKSFDIVDTGKDHGALELIKDPSPSSNDIAAI